MSASAIIREKIAVPSAQQVAAAINSDIARIAGRRGMTDFSRSLAVSVVNRHIRPFVGNRYSARDVGTPEEKARGELNLAIYDHADEKLITFSSLLSKIHERRI